MRTTKLFVIEPGKAPRLMNTITPVSRFHSIPVKDGELFFKEGQMRVAETLRDGWVRANHFPRGTEFNIVQEGF